MGRIVLAYSGGLDTSVAVPWPAETYHADVITVTMDLGQGRELDSVRERALAAGAVRAHVLDVRAEFADHYILPALQAGAIYEGCYPLATCDEGHRFDHRAAEEFIKIWGLPVETVARRRKQATVPARTTEAA